MLESLSPGCAGKPEHLSCRVYSVGPGHLIGNGVVDRGGAVKYQADLFRQILVPLVVQSHLGFGDISHDKDNPAFD